MCNNSKERIKYVFADGIYLYRDTVYIKHGL